MGGSLNACRPVGGHRGLSALTWAVGSCALTQLSPTPEAPLPELPKYRGPDRDDPRWKVFRDFREPAQLVRIAIDQGNRVFVHFNGRGSVDGARSVTEMMDQVRDELGHDVVFEALVDMRDLDGAPLRAQFVIGKWLLGRKKQIAKVAIFGGKPFEMKVAAAVLRQGRRARSVP